MALAKILCKFATAFCRCLPRTGSCVFIEATGLVAVLLSELLLKLRDRTRPEDSSGVSLRKVDEYLEFADICETVSAKILQSIKE